MTTSICRSASATLEQLTRDLEPGGRAEFRDPAGVHMTLYVSRLPEVPAGSLFTIAHAHAGHIGEPICDPLVTLLRAVDGSWVPLEITTPFAHVVTAEAGDPVRIVARDEHRRLLKLVEIWMRNVSANLLRAHHVLQKEEVCSLAEYLTA
jgi:hypothetical protein